MTKSSRIPEEGEAFIDSAESGSGGETNGRRVTEGPAGCWQLMPDKA